MRVAICADVQCTMRNQWQQRHAAAMLSMMHAAASGRTRALTSRDNASTAHRISCHGTSIACFALLRLRAALLEANLADSGRQFCMLEHAFDARPICRPQHGCSCRNSLLRQLFTLQILYSQPPPPLPVGHAVAPGLKSKCIPALEASFRRTSSSGCVVKRPNGVCSRCPGPLNLLCRRARRTAHRPSVGTCGQ